MAGGNIQYFLIAQDNEHQDFSIVPICANDYCDNGRYEPIRSGKLEQIDLFTTRFANEEHILNYLYETGRIDTKSAKLYIAFQPKQNSNLKFYEVLYNFNNNSDIIDLKNIALSNLKLGGSLPYQRAENILSGFYDLVSRDDQFYNMLASNMTNIYGKFLDYFKTKHRYEGIEELRDFDGAWAFRSYTLLRNIVEAQEKYRSLMKMNGNVYENASLKNRINERFRLKVRDELAIQLDPDYDPNQLSLFDYVKTLAVIQEDKVSESTPTKPKVKNPEKKQAVFRVKDVPEYSEIPMAEKRKFVLHTLLRLPSRTYQMVDRKIIINLDGFEVPIDDYDQMCLEKYLDGSTKSRARLITFFAERIQEEHDKNNYYTSQLEEDYYAEKKSLNRYLYNHDTALNRAYAWCKLYSQYEELNCQFISQKSEESSFGSNESGAYVKKDESRKHF